MKKRVVILTGAGISAESGIQTFRDSDGLWNSHNVQDVATPQAFNRNPELVLDFYNQRRKDILNVEPNAAHLGLVKLEDQFEVNIITQNIDNLHERAGSKHILHLHGEIFKMRSVKNNTKTFPILGDMHIGDLADDGGQLRPFIVWFNEDVPEIIKAANICRQADILVIIGTSMVVYPAAGLSNNTSVNTPLYIIDKNIPEINLNRKITRIEQPATIGVQTLLDMLLV